MKKYFGVVLLVFLSVSIAITAQQANPASDFKYDISSDGKGITIKKYLGSAKNVIIPSVIEDFPVVDLDLWAFKDSNIESVVIPGSVKRVSGFFDCKKLKKIVLSEGVESVGGFDGCTSLTSITIPDSVRSVYGFIGCTSLANVYLGKGLEWVDGFERCTALVNVTIGNGVETIGSEAFAECTSLTSIILGDNLKKISEKAFRNCTSLTSVIIGKGIKRIDDDAFLGCSSLTTFNIGVQKLDNVSFRIPRESSSSQWGGYGWSTFKGCSSLSLKEKKKIRDTGYTGEF